MPARVNFDCATLSDAVQKAARVAPVKGNAYDKAAGVTFEYRNPSDIITIKSTDLDTSYTQRVKCSDIKAEGDFAWRIPSVVLAGLAANLPMGSGSQVTFIDKDDRSIRITCGNMVVKLNLIGGEFPEVKVFPTYGFAEASDFAKKVSQVAWACKKDNSVLSGVRVDGESLIGCNGNAAAIVPCVVALSEPVTVPLSQLAYILRTATDVRVAAGDNKLQIMLDEESQATSNIFSGDYPDVKKLMRKDHTLSFQVTKVAFTEAVNRMMVVARADRLPAMKLTVKGQDVLVKTLTMDLTTDAGRIMDSVMIDTEYEGEFDIWFTPEILVQAIDNAAEEKVTVSMGHPNPERSSLSSVLVTDTLGYEALVMPRQP